MALFESYEKKRDRQSLELINSLNIQNLSDEDDKKRLQEAVGTYVDALNARYVEEKTYLSSYATAELDFVIIKMLDEVLTLLKKQ